MVKGGWFVFRHHTGSVVESWFYFRYFSARRSFALCEDRDVLKVWLRVLSRQSNLNVQFLIHDPDKLLKKYDPLPEPEVPSHWIPGNSQR